MTLHQMILIYSLGQDKYVGFKESSPPSHIKTHSQRRWQRRWSCSHFQFCPINKPEAQTKNPIIFVVAYQVPGPYTEFLAEFSEFLPALVLKT